MVVKHDGNQADSKAPLAVALYLLCRTESDKLRSNRRNSVFLRVRRRVAL